MDNSGNRYSVLLVDDEEDVIRIIMKKLDWESMGLTIIGHAANGVEALEMAEELSPDIVMTDIKMPYMDGLTLCRKLKELSRTIRVIIFSGFDEFEYAKEAIKMEAEEYLLKPVNAVELKEVFERVKNDLDRELDEKRNTDKLREYYMESLPVLQESFYMALLEGRIVPEQINRYMENYQVHLNGPYYVVTVLHISQQSMEEEPKMDPFLQAVSVRKFAEEQAEDRWRSRVVIYLGDIIPMRWTGSAGWQRRYAMPELRQGSGISAIIWNSFLCLIREPSRRFPIGCSMEIQEPSVFPRWSRQNMRS